ncbi:MAG: lactate utilization protein B/C [Chitinophagaceae bacterium]|nr:MAG: lactate utilization protein B/C [Chitinophagaceae bacterium]
MSSREKILKEIAQNKPAAISLPAPFLVEREQQPLLPKFMEMLQSIGGEAKLVEDWHEVLYCLQQKISDGLEVANAVQKLAPYNIEHYRTKSGAEVQTVHSVFLQGGIAVAENAAIWVSEVSMGNRMLPFICEQLIIVINQSDIVATMHDAYERLRVNEDGYGVFIAGPSKTADIEQSLVIGAHGPLSLQVFIVKRKLNNKFHYETDTFWRNK